MSLFWIAVIAHILKRQVIVYHKKTFGSEDILISILPIQNRSVLSGNYLYLQTISTSTIAIHKFFQARSHSTCSFSPAILTFIKFQPLKIPCSYPPTGLGKATLPRIKGGKKQDKSARETRFRATRKGTAVMHGRSWRKFWKAIHHDISTPLIGRTHHGHVLPDVDTSHIREIIMLNARWLQCSRNRQICT